MGPDDPRAPTQEFMLKLSYNWSFVDVFGSRWVRRLLQSVVLLALNACHSDNAAGARKDQQYVRRKYEQAAKGPLRVPFL